jgi:hypothetical protein
MLVSYESKMQKLRRCEIAICDTHCYYESYYYDIYCTHANLIYFSLYLICDTDCTMDSFSARFVASDWIKKLPCGQGMQVSESKYANKVQK